MPENELETHITRQIAFAGPIPPADEFAKYEQTLSGTADRLLTIAEKEVEHRHKNIDKETGIFGRGQLFAFAISVLSLGAVCLSVVFKQPIASIAPTIIAITGLASIFVNKKKQ